MNDDPAAFDQPTVDEFHRLYYECRDETWMNTRWLGVRTFKCPLDLWIYQEILHEVRPDVIVECGTAEGGTALFLASMCALIGRGRVLSIDISPDPHAPRHPLITYLVGSSTSGEVVENVRGILGDEDRVMVILDSDHAREHVLDEMRLYGELVTEGSYLIVEDTNVNGHPVLPEFGPGPMEAVNEFLNERPDFLIDESREKFFMTFNPRGYLRRVARSRT